MTTTKPPTGKTGWSSWPLWAKITVPSVGVIMGLGMVSALAANENTTERPAVQGFLDTGTTTAAPIAATTSTLPPATTVTTPPTTVAVTVPPTTAAPVTTAARPPAPTTAAAPATDPRFGTCKEAKAHGYGPYVRGRDPEYSWYRDGDGDGITCE